MMNEMDTDPQYVVDGQSGGTTDVRCGCADHGHTPNDAWVLPIDPRVAIKRWHIDCVFSSRRSGQGAIALARDWGNQSGKTTHAPSIRRIGRDFSGASPFVELTSELLWST
jgi:hypothetical protein